MAPAIPLNTRSLSRESQVKHVLLALKRHVTDSIHKLRSVSSNILAARQNTGTTDGQVGTIIPTTYNQQGGLAPGAVAGIVLGTVFGIILFIVIVAWAMQANSGIDPSVDERIEVRDRAVSPSSRGHRRRRRKSRRDYDVADVRVVRDASPRRRASTRIVEERIVEERRPNRSRASSVVVPMEEVYIDRRPRRGSNVEVVVEESDFSSEPRKKRKSKRRSR